MYYLINQANISGIFSVILTIVGHLIKAENLKRIPIINITNKVILYNNPWDDYFKSVNKYINTEDSDVLIQDSINSLNILRHDIVLGRIPNINQVKYIVKKYCIPNKQTQIKLDKELQKFKNKPKILGIHARGTDGGLNGGINTAFKASDIKHIKKLIKNKNYTHIYLATEDINNYNTFKAEFEDIIITQENVFRYNFTYDESNVIDLQINLLQRQKYAEIMNISIDEAKYLMGLEAIIDSILLSKCQGILGHMSGVTNFSVYYTETIQEFYTYQMIRNT